MKQTIQVILLIIALVLFCVSVSAQTYQYAIDEPESNLQIEYTESTDSVFIFTFTSLKGDEYSVTAKGAYWRNGDFINIYLNEAWQPEVMYRLVGGVKVKKIKKV